MTPRRPTPAQKLFRMRQLLRLLQKFLTDSDSNMNREILRQRIDRELEREGKR